MKKLKKIALILTALSLTACLGFVAGANETTQQIMANLSYGITVKMNGQPVNMTDATGAPVYPIVYNGTTYLPVRAVANIVGLPVDWDGSTSSVLLGYLPTPDDESITKATADMITYEPAFGFTNEYDAGEVITNALDLVVGGMQYDLGYKTSARYSKAVVQLDKKFTTMHVKAVCLDNHSGKLSFNVGYSKLKETKLENGVVQDIEVDVSNLDQVDIKWWGEKTNSIVLVTDIYFK